MSQVDKICIQHFCKQLRGKCSTGHFVLLSAFVWRFQKLTLWIQLQVHCRNGTRGCACVCASSSCHHKLEMLSN